MTLYWHTLICYLYIGGRVGESDFDAERSTYVYPTELKTLVRARFQEDIEDSPKPSGPSVPEVSYCSITAVILSWTIYCLLLHHMRHVQQRWANGDLVRNGFTFPEGNHVYSALN